MFRLQYLTVCNSLSTVTIVDDKIDPFHQCLMPSLRSNWISSRTQVIANDREHIATRVVSFIQSAIIRFYFFISLSEVQVSSRIDDLITFANVVEAVGSKPTPVSFDCGLYILKTIVPHLWHQNNKLKQVKWKQVKWTPGWHYGKKQYTPPPVLCVNSHTHPFELLEFYIQFNDELKLILWHIV